MKKPSSFPLCPVRAAFLALDLSWPQMKDLSAVVSLQDLTFPAAEMAPGFKASGVCSSNLKLGRFLQPLKAMLDVAGESTLFHPAPPQTHCPCLEKKP